MKSSPRPLLLVPTGAPLNKKRRYFNMKNALKKAIELHIDAGVPLLIYDADRGIDLVTVRRKTSEIVAIIHSPRLFNKHWNT